MTLSEGDSDIIMHDTRTIVSATDTVMANMRTDNGVPTAHADSIKLFPSAAACDSAALVYDSLRASRGDTTGHRPIALLRILGTKVFIGTQLQDWVGFREYVVFDATDSFKGKIYLGP